MRRYRVRSIAARALLALLGLPLAAAAQDAGALRVELNKLEPQKGACRAYLVFENETGNAFSGLTLDLILFNGDGIIARRVAVNAAPLPAGKTSVKLFDMEGLTCDAIGRILINGVLACEDESGPRTNCAALIEPASRADASLIK